MTKEIKKKESLQNLLFQANQLAVVLNQMGGELSEANEKLLEEITKKLARKVDSYAFVMDKIAADVAFLKEKEKEVATHRKVLEKNAERIQELMKFEILKTENKELKGKNERLYLTPTQGSVRITDEKEADRLFGEDVVTTTRKIPLTKIKEAIESGQEVTCAKIIQNWQLRKGRVK